MAEILSRNQEIPWRIIEGQVVLLDLDEARAIMLNEVGSYIWIELERGLEAGELIDKIIMNFDIDQESARKDLSLFLDSMLKRDLLQVNRG